MGWTNADIDDGTFEALIPLYYFHVIGARGHRGHCLAEVT